MIEEKIPKIRIEAVGRPAHTIATTMAWEIHLEANLKHMNFPDDKKLKELDKLLRDYKLDHERDYCYETTEGELEKIKIDSHLEFETWEGLTQFIKTLKTIFKKIK